MATLVKHFGELRVYQAAFHLQQELFELSKTFPVEEKYSLTSQLRRSSRSVGASVAEAWQKRRYEAAFVHKLTDADAELAESEHWLSTGLACGYFDREVFDAYESSSRRIGRMLGAMIRDASSWCLQQ